MVNFIENFQCVQSTAAEFKLNPRLDIAGTGVTRSKIPVEFKAVSDLPNLSCWVQKAESKKHRLCVLQVKSCFCKIIFPGNILREKHCEVLKIESHLSLPVEGS